MRLAAAASTASVNRRVIQARLVGLLVDLDPPEADSVPVDGEDRGADQLGVRVGSAEEVGQEVALIAAGPWVCEDRADVGRDRAGVGACAERVGEELGDGELGGVAVGAHEVGGRGAEGLHGQVVDEGDRVGLDGLPVREDPWPVDQAGQRTEHELEGLGGLPGRMQLEGRVVADDVRCVM